MNKVLPIRVYYTFEICNQLQFLEKMIAHLSQYFIGLYVYRRISTILGNLKNNLKVEFVFT
ncbi:MAG: hypothetical protein RL037_1340 [Bacteroidota bacterium]|jgi:hypothetical protein